MMRLITTLLIVLSFGCTITVKPLPKPRKYVYNSSRHSMREHTRSSQLVIDSDWLMQYRQLEEEHGNYKISDDSKVESVGGGKYRVTKSMLRHFRDLSQTPMSTPTPAP